MQSEPASELHSGEMLPMLSLLMEGGDVSAIKAAVLELAKGPLSPELKNLLAEVVRSLGSVTTRLGEEKDSAQSLHDLEFQKFADEAAQYRSEIAGAMSHSTDTGAKRQLHIQCRNDERGLRSNLVGCRAREETSRTDFQSATTEANAQGTVMGFGGPSNQWFGGSLAQLQSFAAAVQTLAEERQEFEQTEAECTALQGQTDAKQQECNGLQSEYESSTCVEGEAFAMARHTYLDQYATISDLFTAASETWRSDSEHRSHTCGAIATLSCYVEHISDSQNAAGTSYESSDCENIDLDSQCAHVYMDPTQLPPPADLEAVPPMACSSIGGPLDYGVPEAELAPATCCPASNIPCSSAISCSEHGSVAGSFPDCSCACEAGWFGHACDLDRPECEFNVDPALPGEYMGDKCLASNYFLPGESQLISTARNICRPYWLRCQEAHIIHTEAECIEAMHELNMPGSNYRNVWNVQGREYQGGPLGCNVDQNGNVFYFTPHLLSDDHSSYPLTMQGGVMQPGELDRNYFMVSACKCP